MIDITPHIQLAVAPGGGRLFGVGVRTAKEKVDQLFRIDYWDTRHPILLVNYYGVTRD
jgi:hypothetical protein